MRLMENFPLTSQISLESQLDKIALEGEVLSNMLETFKSIIPNFLNNLRDTNLHLVATTEEQSDISISLSRKERNTIEAARHIDFINFGERLISVPEGFKGNLLKYSELLNQIATEAYQAQNTIIAEYNVILSSFITNKEDKLSLKDHTSFFERIKSEREGFAKRLSEFSASSTGVSKARFRDCVTRMAEVEPLFVQAAKLSQKHSRAKLQEINNAVNHSVDLLDIIINGVLDGKITHISPNATNNISKGAYELAKYVEFIGIIYFDITVFLNTLNGLSDTIINVNQS